MKTLPRGIWYESEKKRYRVRKYHNKVPYLKGYYRSYGEAVEALEELERELARIPKLPRRRRGNPTQAPVPATSVSGIIGAVQQRQQFDPALLKRKKNG